jgi:hypothetical protein
MYSKLTVGDDLHSQNREKPKYRRTIARDISELVWTPIILMLIEATVSHSELLHIPQFLQYDIAHSVLPPLTTQQ